MKYLYLILFNIFTFLPNESLGQKANEMKNIYLQFLILTLDSFEISDSVQHLPIIKENIEVMKQNLEDGRLSTRVLSDFIKEESPELDLNNANLFLLRSNRWFNQYPGIFSCHPSDNGKAFIWSYCEVVEDQYKLKSFKYMIKDQKVLITSFETQNSCLCLNLKDLQRANIPCED